MSISMELSDKDLKKMKFTMKGQLNDIQSVEMPIHLFRLMMQHKMLSETNLDPLVQLLIGAKRYDLSSKVQQMKGKQQ